MGARCTFEPRVLNDQAARRSESRGETYRWDDRGNPRQGRGANTSDPVWSVRLAASWVPRHGRGAKHKTKGLFGWSPKILPGTVTGRTLQSLLSWRKPRTAVAGTVAVEDVVVAARTAGETPRRERRKITGKCRARRALGGGRVAPRTHRETRGRARAAPYQDCASRDGLSPIDCPTPQL